MTRKQKVEEEEQESSPLIFQDFDSDTVLLVYRKHQTKRTPEFLFRMSPDEATPDLIKDIAGGGEYLIKERVRKEGRITWGRFRSLDIAGQPREPDTTKLPGNSGRPVEFIAGGHPKTAEDFARERKEAEVGAHQVGLQDVMTAGILDLLKAGRESQQLQLEALRSTLSARPTVDWPALITAVGTVLGPVLAAMLDRKRDDLNPISLVADVAKVLKDTAGPKSSLKEQLEIYQLIEELRGGRGGDDEGGIDGLLARGLKDVLVAGAQARAQQPPQPAPMGMLPPGEGQTPAAEEGDIRMLAIVRALGPYRKQLVQLSTQGKDPVISAEFLVEMLPEPAREQLILWITEGGSLETAMKLVPEFAQTPIWAQEFWDSMVEALGLAEGAEEEEEEEEIVEEKKTKRSRAASPRQKSNPKQEE